MNCTDIGRTRRADGRAAAPAWRQSRRAKGGRPFGWRARANDGGALGTREKLRAIMKTSSSRGRLVICWRRARALTPPAAGWRRQHAGAAQLGQARACCCCAPIKLARASADGCARPSAGGRAPAARPAGAARPSWRPFGAAELVCGRGCDPVPNRRPLRARRWPALIKSGPRRWRRQVSARAAHDASLARAVAGRRPRPGGPERADGRRNSSIISVRPAGPKGRAPGASVRRFVPANLAPAGLH